ncbi:hypothetical protein WN51_00889 [Melipona quadrifasciata]|uniref:Uncharacterized protein n=1 Tax=Melipona quadrifasciata TaxID=166423 RepID=A0A0N0U7L0_9HYME|nr:hypothetical protein WN51_00889 [Melipona quadrifasciata]
MIRIPGNVVLGRLLTLPLFNTYVRGLSIGSQSGIAAILAMDSPDAAELRRRRLLVLPWQYRSGECPTAAKGGCCFLRTGRVGMLPAYESINYLLRPVS